MSNHCMIEETAAVALRQAQGYGRLGRQKAGDKSQLGSWDAGMLEGWSEVSWDDGKLGCLKGGHLFKAYSTHSSANYLLWLNADRCKLSYSGCHPRGIGDPGLAFSRQLILNSGSSLLIA